MEMQKLDTISNNLANVNTTGYKRDIFTTVPFKDMLIKRINDPEKNTPFPSSVGKLAPGVCVSEIYTDYAQGGQENTGNKLDAAINGNGFFTVKANSNNRQGTFYTRDGSFMLNAQGNLITNQGDYVMGQNGNIKLNPNSSNISIKANGDILQDGKLVDRLNIVSFQDTSTLRKIGDNLISTTAQSKTNQFTGTVAQGTLETSNVNTIKEMVAMITANRTFESDQRALKAQDDMLGKAVSEVGAVR
jgi:flagellar basal-body rod protein FlgG